MNPRAAELINLELDGRLDAAGRAELDALLADPAVAAHRTELRAVVRWLAGAPAEAPPEGFREAVLERAQRASRAFPRRVRWRRRAVLALAASLVMAVVVLQVLDDAPGPESAALSGTLAPALPAMTSTRTAEGWRLVFQLPPGPEADLVITVAGPDPLLAEAAVRTDRGFGGRTEGGRIVVPGAGSGRTTVWIDGFPAVTAISAAVRRGAVETPVTERQDSR